MPFYHIQHSADLTPSQRQALATAITNLHSTTFNAPSLFVNIKFSPSDQTSTSSSSEDFFVGGTRKGGVNVIFAFVRSGGTRGQEAFDKLASDIEDHWNDVVGNKNKLQGVFVVPGLVARERSLAIPPVSIVTRLYRFLAGQEGKWLEENWADFERMAKDGDEDFKSLVDEVGRRPELRGKN